MHVIDASGSEGRDPVEDYLAINRELAGYDASLAEKPQIVVLNKADMMTDFSVEDKIRALGAGEVLTMSAIQHAAWTNS